MGKHTDAFFFTILPFFAHALNLHEYISEPQLHRLQTAPRPNPPVTHFAGRISANNSIRSVSVTCHAHATQLASLRSPNQFDRRSSEVGMAWAAASCMKSTAGLCDTRHFGQLCVLMCAYH